LAIGNRWLHRDSLVGAASGSTDLTNHVDTRLFP